MRESAPRARLEPDLTYRTTAEWEWPVCISYRAFLALWKTQSLGVQHQAYKNTQTPEPQTLLFFSHKLPPGGNISSLSLQVTDYLKSNESWCWAHPVYVYTVWVCGCLCAYTAGMLSRTKELECGTKMRNITDPACSALLHSMFSLGLSNIKIQPEQKQLSYGNFP